MLDPISDMLTRIRNAQKAGHSEVLVSFSKMKLAIANILVKEGFLDSVEKEKDDNKDGNIDRIKIGLKYEKVNSRKTPIISEIKRVSKEGQRAYVKKDQIKKVKNNFGIAIISTSKGIMTGRDAHKLGLGGEYICQVW